jgi:transcriptional regulator with XRE-family HTH domain
MPLYDRRRLAGLTQAALADLVGVTKVSVHNWERGLCMPRRANREKLAKLLGGDEAEYTRAWAPPVDPALIDEAFWLLARAEELRNGHRLAPYYDRINDYSIQVLRSYIAEPAHPDLEGLYFLRRSARITHQHWLNVAGDDPFYAIRMRAIAFYDRVLGGGG